MKKNYIAPHSTPYALLWENGVALNILSGGNTPTIGDDEILSNKEENPVWKNNGNGGMWDGKND